MTRRHVVVAIALTVGGLHFMTGPRYAGPFPGFVNGYLIDICLPFAMYLVLGMVDRPSIRRPVARGSLVLATGTSVEIAQRLGVPLFGRTYDPLDFVAYAVGILGAVLFERAVLVRLPVTRAP